MCERTQPERHSLRGPRAGIIFTIGDLELMRTSIGTVLALSLLLLSACGKGDDGTNPVTAPVHVHLTVDSTSITLPTGGVAAISVAATPTPASATVSLSAFYWTADCVIAWVG